MCFPVYAASRSLTKAYGPLLAASGLTYPQYLTMLALWSSGDAMTVGQLGDRLYLDSGTLTPLLKRLEAAGHISRQRDPDDERRVMIAVTDAGWDLRNAVADVPAKMVDLIGMSAEDAVELRDRLNALLQHLESD